MIIFLTHPMHGYTHIQLKDRKDLPVIECRSYRWLLNRKTLPRATYIFTDRERMDAWEVRVFGAFARHLAAAGPGYRVVGDPGRMMSRRTLLRALHARGINDFNAYALAECRNPERFPVFLRREHDHAAPISGLLYSQEELEAAIKEMDERGEPEEGVIIIEFCAEPVHGDLYRKLAAYRVGKEVLFFNTVHERSWLVKYGTRNSATDTLYQEEQEMITSNAFSEQLRRAFDIGRIEYGRADFGLVDGRVQIYEINSNPQTVPPAGHPNPIRSRNIQLGWDRYCAALTALDTTDSRAPFAPPFEHSTLRGRRMPHGRMLRGRFVNR